MPMGMRLFIIVLLLSSFSLAQLLYSDYPILPANVPLETALLQATNAARSANGLTSLQHDEQLAIAARHHALEMVTLNYFSHQSPTPGMSSPPQRAAKAGSPYIFIGENIAKMPPGNIAQATTEGWMGSPGHRANLLSSEFTHVGFGTAQDQLGYTYVVQMFAFKPFILRSAEVKTQILEGYRLALEVELNQASTVVFGVADDLGKPIPLQAGTQTVEFMTTATQQIYLQAAVASEVENGYIVQDGGWLNLETNTFSPDQIAPKTFLHFVDANAQRQQQPVSEVTLLFDGAMNKQLGIFVNDVFMPNALIASGTLRVKVPQGQDATLTIGELQDNQVNIYLRLKVSYAQGKPILMASATE